MSPYVARASGDQGNFYRADLSEPTRVPMASPLSSAKDYSPSTMIMNKNVEKKAQVNVSSPWCHPMSPIGGIISTNNMF